MTNAMIILLESVKLMENGILAPTGQKIVVEYNDGEQKEVDIPECIHTYQHWKSLGYQVKKGQKAIAQFPIWKYIKNGKEKQEEEQVTEEEAQKRGYCYMKMSSFFKQDQVEKIEEVK